MKNKWLIHFGAFFVLIFLSAAQRTALSTFHLPSSANLFLSATVSYFGIFEFLAFFKNQSEKTPLMKLFELPNRDKLFFLASLVFMDIFTIYQGHLFKNVSEASNGLAQHFIFALAFISINILIFIPIIWIFGSAELKQALQGKSICDVNQQV